MAAANDYFSDTSEFDLARKRAEQQSASNLQMRQDALKRRFAALGNLDSGARIKIEQRVANEEGQNLNAAREGIDAAQRAELGRRALIKQGQEFQAGESQKGRDFLAAENLRGREFTTAERLGGQDFASGEALKGREFMTAERLGGQDFASQQNLLNIGFQREQNTANREAAAKEAAAGRRFAGNEGKLNRALQSTMHDDTLAFSRDQLKTAMEQFDRTYLEDVRTSKVSEELAREAAKNDQKGGALEQLGSTVSLPNIYRAIGIR